jgi:N-acetylglucosamine-6-phosphate deacetylase
VAWLNDRTAFAGSVATTDRLLRTMVCEAGVPLSEAVKMLTTTPARLVGIDGAKGALAPGMDADLVVLDERLTARLTVVEGRIVHQAL